jgi:hypothetical protein
VPRRPAEEKEFIQGLEQGFFEVSTAKVVSSKEKALGRVSGREAIADGFAGKWVRHQVYAVGNHAYQLVVFSNDRAALESEETEKFLASFQILDLPPAPAVEKNASHELGRFLGRVLGMGAVVLVIVLVVRSLRKKTPSR